MSKKKMERQAFKYLNRAMRLYDRFLHNTCHSPRMRLSKELWRKYVLPQYRCIDENEGVS